MARIFISYRRDDSASISGRIYDRLVAKFGRKRVFKGVDDIPAGVDFNDKVVTALLDSNEYRFVFFPIRAHT